MVGVDLHARLVPCGLDHLGQDRLHLVRQAVLAGDRTHHRYLRHSCPLSVLRDPTGSRPATRCCVVSGGAPPLMLHRSPSSLPRIGQSLRRNSLYNAETPPRTVAGPRRDLFSPGGEGGIRTHGDVAATHAFQACRIGHSRTSPSCAPGKARSGRRTRLPGALLDDRAPMVVGPPPNSVAGSRGAPLWTEPWYSVSSGSPIAPSGGGRVLCNHRP